MVAVQSASVADAAMTDDERDALLKRMQAAQTAETDAKARLEEEEEVRLSTMLFAQGCVQQQRDGLMST
jgi:hypothetical protein